MEKKLCGVLMAFGASEAAMNNDDYFQNGKKILKNTHQKFRPKNFDSKILTQKF